MLSRCDPLIKLSTNAFKPFSHCTATEYQIALHVPAPYCAALECTYTYTQTHTSVYNKLKAINIKHAHESINIVNISKFNHTCCANTLILEFITLWTNKNFVVNTNRYTLRNYVKVTVQFLLSLPFSLYYLNGLVFRGWTDFCRCYDVDIFLFFSISDVSWW